MPKYEPTAAEKIANIAAGRDADDSGKKSSNVVDGVSKPLPAKVSEAPKVDVAGAKKHGDMMRGVSSRGDRWKPGPKERALFPGATNAHFGAPEDE